MQPLGPSEWILSGKSWSGNLLNKTQKKRAWFQFKISNKRNWGHLHCHSLPKIPGSWAAVGGERLPYREGAPFMGPFLFTSRFPLTFTILIPLLWDNLWPDPKSGWFISLGHVQLCVSSAQEFYFYPAALLKYLHLFWGESAGFHRLGALKLRFWADTKQLPGKVTCTWSVCERPAKEVTEEMKTQPLCDPTPSESQVPTDLLQQL